MSPPRSLSEGNRLQRAYYRWAQPYYARMDPQAREQSILIDRFLYSRRGVGVWLGLLAAVVGSSAGLHRSGMAAWLAVVLSLLVWVAVPLVLLAAWLQPASASGDKLRRAFPRIVLLGAAGALLGFVAGHVAKQGRLDLELLAAQLWQSLSILGLAALLGAAAMLALMWGVAGVRRQVLERELSRLRLEQERDAASREAVQAQLKLLQAQIQPHFIFNTLSAVQHWVDQGDARAGALLRSLTTFLRGSTEALGREETSLDAETCLVRHYLEVMQARLGDRLRWTVDIAPELMGQKLPPGLLLTLVENAIEHGITASLAGGEVSLRAWREQDHAVVEIADDAALWSPQAVDGVGLSNCRARLHHRHGDAASLTLAVRDGRTCARLRWPLVDGARPQAPT